MSPLSCVRQSASKDTPSAHYVPSTRLVSDTQSRSQGDAFQDWHRELHAYSAENNCHSRRRAAAHVEVLESGIRGTMMDTYKMPFIMIKKMVVQLRINDILQPSNRDGFVCWPLGRLH